MTSAIALRKPAAIVRPKTSAATVVVRPRLVPDFGDGDDGGGDGAFAHLLGEGPNWVIGAYCAEEGEHYYYLAVPKGRGWTITEMWPTPGGCEVGRFATIDDAASAILDALEEE